MAGDAPHRARITRILSDPSAWCAAFVVLAAVAIAWRTLADVAYLYYPLPMCDYWDFIGQLPHYLSPDFRLTELWDQHNEHRILFPRLVFLTDALWFGGNGALCVVLACLLQCAHAALLSCAVAATMPRGPSRFLAGAAMAACLMFGSQSINLFWSFQVQFVLVYLTVTASLHQLARPQPGPGRLLAAVLLACVASGSMANGLLVWPLLWSLAVQMRLPRRYLTWLVAAGALMLFAYFKDYNPPAGSTPRDALLEPVGILDHLCILFGNPLWSLGIVPAELGGGITMALVVWTLGRRLRTWRQATPVQALLVHLVLFVVATVGMVGVGRLTFSRETMLNARYGLPPLVLWSALLGLMFTGMRPGGAPWWRVATATAFVSGLAILSPLHRDAMQGIRENQSAAAACLLTGVADTNFLCMTHDVDPAWTLNRADILKSRRLSVFGTGLQYLVGTDLMDHFAVEREARATAYVAPPKPVTGHPGALYLEGWAYHQSTLLPPELILVVDDRWRIVGLGLCCSALPDITAEGRPLPDPQIHWHAWAREVDQPGRELWIYGVWSGVAVPFQKTQGEGDDERSLTSDIERLGAPVALNALELNGSWIPGGWYPGSPAPPHGTVGFGSFNGADSSTGRLRASIIARPDAGELLVPLLTGPNAMAMIVRIVDGKTRAAQASLRAPRPFNSAWHVWRVELPARNPGDCWILEAEDRGRGAGQWFAIATPCWAGTNR